MAKKDDKTNVMRLLDSKKIPYKEYTYLDNLSTNGVEIANILGEDLDRVFKTLVTVSKSKTNYVFVIPVGSELNLKKAAKAVGEKSIEMVKQKDLFNLTGYVHGGCSPIGMKKYFRTIFHSSALEKDTIYVSGGKVGYQIELSLSDIEKVIRLEVCDIIN